MQNILKHFSLLCLLACLSVFAASAQEPVDTIQVTRIGLGNVYSYQGNQLSTAQLKQIISSDATASKLFRKARTLGIVSTGISCVGGYMIGEGLAGTFFHQDNALREMGIGAGVALCGLAFSWRADKLLTRAVRQYNGSLQGSDMTASNIELSIGPTSSGGLGLSLTF